MMQSDLKKPLTIDLGFSCSFSYFKQSSAFQSSLKKEKKENKNKRIRIRGGRGLRKETRHVVTISAIVNQGVSKQGVQSEIKTELKTVPLITSCVTTTI